MASGASITIDASRCDAFGLNPYPDTIGPNLSSPPSHGTLSVNTLTGAIIYINNGDGATSDVFTVTDASDVPFTVNVTIAPATSPLTVTPATLPNPAVSVPYSQQLTTTGGTAPYTYSIISGSGGLPPGLNMSNTGLISGTPTGASNYNFTVRVLDSAGTPATLDKSYSVNVAAPVLDLAPDSPPNGAVNQPYSQQFSVSGGTAPYTYSVEAGLGNLPPGMSLSSTGLLSGTPTATGNYTFSLRYDDNTTSSQGPGVQYFAAQNVTVNIVAIPAPTVTSITPTSGPTAGGTMVAITGTNFTGATAVRFGATNATSFVVINATSITATAPAGSVGTYDVTVTTPGGTSATSAADQYTYVAAPTVTSISPTYGPTAGGTSVVITGTNFTGATAVTFGGIAATSFTVNNATSINATSPAKSAGTVDVRVTTTGGTSATSAADQFTHIDPPDLIIMIGHAGNATQGQVGFPYTITVSNSGAGATNSMVTVTGTMPAGLTATAMSGTGWTCNLATVTCTRSNALASGANYPSITLTTNVAVNAPASVTMTATVSGGGETNTGNDSASDPTTILAGVPVANAVSATVAYNSTNNPITLNITGGAPISAAVGTPASHGTATASGTSIAYTPTAGYAGPDSFTYTATNAAGTSAPATATITVSPPVITYTPSNPPAATAGAVYSQSLASASGGAAPYTYSIYSGALPAGMTLSTNGTLSGTPIAGGTFNFTVRATDASTGTGPFDATSGSLSLTVNAATVVVSPASGALPGTAAESPYSQTFTASGGTAPYSWAITAGSLPPGMTLGGSGGVLSGTPTAAGTFNFTVTATDASTGAGPYTGSASYSLTVTAPTITVSPASLPAASAGSAYSQTITASGGSGGYAYSLTAGALPPGIAFSSAGVLSGTPTASGTYNFTVTATDGFGFTGSQAYSATIGAGSQTITFGAQAGQTFAPNGTFTLSPVATASSGLAVSYSSQTGTVCTISGTTVTMLSAGTCTIAADQAGDANWNAASQVTQDIAIAQVTQTITNFKANPAAPTYAPNGTFAISATAGGSTSPVVFASTTATVCTVSGTTVTMLAAGTCSLTADQAGDANYTAAPQVALDVSIGKAIPVLSWIADIAKVYGEAAFDLPDPGSTGSGTFTFASSDAQVATISGHTVTITGAGTATLTATQATTANYQSGSISITLTVDARPDPTRDPSVAAGLQAQVDASVRFAQAQQDNIRGRLDQLRNGSNASSNAVGLRVQGGIGQPGLSLSANQVQGATPKMASGWGFWSAGSIVLGERDANGASRGFDFRSDGVTFGIDRLVGDDAAFGVSGGFGWNDDDFDDEGSSLDARQRSLALYGQWHAQSWFVGGVLGWGRLDFDIARWSEDAQAKATAQRDGEQRFASMTVGYDHHGEAGTITGYGRLDASRTALDAYRESGLGIYDLRYARQDVDNSTAALGVQGRHTFRTARATLQPNWMLEWRQALQNNGDAGINYVVLPRSDDYVLGLRSYNDDTLAFGAGLDMVFGNGWNLSFQFRREQSRDVYANGFGFRVSWGQPLRMDPYALLAQPESVATGMQPQP
jgi:uncharacterized protein YhjY with autotransporter beta-barrel domain